MSLFANSRQMFTRLFFKSDGNAQSAVTLLLYLFKAKIELFIFRLDDFVLLSWNKSETKVPEVRAWEMIGV